MRRTRHFTLSPETVAVLLIVALWVRSVGSLIALSLTTEKAFVAVGQDVISSQASDLVSQAFYLIVLAICAATILFRINELPRPGLWRIGVVLAPWLWLVSRNAYSGAASADTLLYVFIVLALAALRPHPRVLQALGWLVGITALVAVMFGALMPEAGLLRESTGEFRASDKEALPGWGLLQGMFTSENNLGQYLALGVPAVFLLARWWIRLPVAALVVFTVYWTSSRSALATLIASLVAGGVVWLLVEFGVRRAASVLARIAVGVVALGLVVLPLLGWNDDAFTARAQIWNGSLAEWGSRSPLFGLGTEWYTLMAETETSPLNAAAYHAHNQFVHMLVTGGAVLALVGLAWFLVQAWVITGARRKVLAVGTMIAVGILVSGYLEVPLGWVDRSAFWTVTLVPLVVLFFARPRDVEIGGPRV